MQRLVASESRIVSLGILTTPLQIAIIVVSVTALVGLHATVAALLDRLGNDAQPQIG